MQVLAPRPLATLPVEAPTVQATATHCPYCAMQCGMSLKRDEAVGVGWAVHPRQFPTNNGGLCRKGWTSTELLQHPERLTSPLLRRAKGETLVEVGWDEALDFVARKVQQIQCEHGRDKVAVFGGGGLTNEKAYWLGKFARVALQTPNIDYNGRFCMASAASANNLAFGVDRGLPFPMADIGRANAVLLVGSNAAETMPPIMQYFDALREGGGQFIVVDPRRTPTAATATLHLQNTPGTDLALANGLLHFAIERGFIDHDFIAARTTGWEDVRRVAASYWPDRVESITGVPVKKMQAALEYLHDAERALILSARGAEQQSKGTETVLAFINLALALGKAGKEGSGYGTLTGQGNGQGGREHGQKCDQLPGYRKINDPAHRQYISEVWGIDEADLPRAGKNAYDLLDSLGAPGGPRAMILVGSNLVVSAPRSMHIRERLQSLEMLVVSDLFLSETAELADVVFPVTQWAEEEGTMTNLEGRVLRRVQAKEPPRGVRSDLQVLAGLAARLGKHKYFADPAPRAVWAELRRATKGGLADYSGISYERIEREDGVFWPCAGDPNLSGPEQVLAPPEPDTPRLFLDRFATPDGRARFTPVAHRPAGEEPDSEFPLFLTTGRIMGHYQSGTQTRRVKALSSERPRAFVEMHPALARTHGIAEGEMVRVQSRRGTGEFEARITTTIRRDTVFIPFHWGGQGCANLLTNPELDPISKMPEFKLCAVRIERQ
jgi:assimilatory nitrate reductase catalytic subunit